MDFDQFCVFILSNGRASRVKTVKTLRDQGYTGKIFIIIDDLDPQRDEYLSIFGDSLIIFDKKKYAATTDCITNENKLNCVVFARNACWDIARDLGIVGFLVLDDDYNEFEYRRLASFKNEVRITTKDLDFVFAAFFEYLISTPKIDCLTFFQNGDFLGGDENTSTRGPRRKIMNSFFCLTERPFCFMGKMNEDVNCYLVNGAIGRVFFSFPLMSLRQTATQSNPGGMTDVYLENGTYVKSFYSVICAPSACHVAALFSDNIRIHHKVSWNNAVPKILPEKFKKTPMHTYPASEHRQKTPLKTKFTEAEAEQVSILDDTF